MHILSEDARARSHVFLAVSSAFQELQDVFRFLVSPIISFQPLEQQTNCNYA